MEKVLDSGVPTLVQQYVTCVLINMQRDIQGVVKKAIQDAFPAAWLPKEQSESETHTQTAVDSRDIHNSRQQSEHRATIIVK